MFLKRRREESGEILTVSEQKVLGRVHTGEDTSEKTSGSDLIDEGVPRVLYQKRRRYKVSVDISDLGQKTRFGGCVTRVSEIQVDPQNREWRGKGHLRDRKSLDVSVVSEDQTFHNERIHRTSKPSSSVKVNGTVKECDLVVIFDGL